MSNETKTTGVIPAYDCAFEINTAGRSATPSWTAIKDIEEMQVTIDGNIVEWTPYDQKGWARRGLTGKKIGIAIKGKRNYGDSGNDYVASKLLKLGKDTESQFKVTLPNGDILEYDCIVNTTNAFGGPSNDMNALEAELLSDGEPRFTESK
ncbi:MAG: hypothetical protein NC213_10250 [Acetobacter sp.]|nr:hypothetical protein [Bacteroides sp.]MCM1342115.1 hypothetical protein [Acetobacter sp.]MCM1434334.1 hypothetical protein [Clostridiales bacterium]